MFQMSSKTLAASAAPLVTQPILLICLTLYVPVVDLELVLTFTPSTS